MSQEAVEIIYLWLAALEKAGRAPCIFCKGTTHKIHAEGTQVLLGHTAPVCEGFEDIIKIANGIPLDPSVKA